MNQYIVLLNFNLCYFDKLTASLNVSFFYNDDAK